MSVEQLSKVDHIINLIQELDTNNGYNIFIPSLDKEVLFKQLTTEQLKQLLKTAIIPSVYNTEFILTFNNIIKDNCIDKTINTNDLTIYDKLFILFKTKLECISTDYTFNFTTDEIENYNLDEEYKTVSVLNHFNDFLNERKKFVEEVFQYNNCTIKCNIPTLDTENKFEQAAHRDNNYDTITDNNIQAIIGNTFINELTKFITTVSINEEIINFSDTTFTDKVKIVEKLPVALVNNALKYIEEYRKHIKKLLIFNFRTDTELLLEKEFSLDATLFNI
jgi:hypothetical protein